MAEAYLADTKNASSNTLNALLDIAQQAGIGNASTMSSYDLTSAIKKATGASGNTYGGTIGNKTLNQYGYQTDMMGNITKIQQPSAGAIPDATVAAVGSVYDALSQLPGFSDELYGNMVVTPQLYQQAILAGQMQQQQQQAMEQMKAQYAAQQDAINRQTQATVNSINSNRAGVEDAYQKAQREAYINSVLQQNQMSDYLSAAGYSGGMAESTLAQINNNYANNRQQATSERDAANLEIDRMVADALASGDASLAEAANNYYNNYVAALQNQQQVNYQLSQDILGQMNYEQERQAQAAQTQYEKDLYEREYNDAQARDTAAQDFNTFLNTYKGKYNNKATYEQWIKNLQAMNDPYGYNAQKVAYLQQYINKTFGSGSSGSSSGSGSGGNGSGGNGGSGGGNSPRTTNSALKTVEAQSKMRLANGSSLFNDALVSGEQAGATGAVSYIESQVKNGTISPDEAETILKNLGLL